MNIEKMTILNSYKKAFSFPRIIEKIKSIQTFNSFHDYYKSGQKNGVIVYNMNNHKTICFIQKGQEEIWLVYRNEELLRLMKLKNGKTHSNNGPAFFDFNPENPIISYYINGVVTEQEKYCSEKTSAVETAEVCFSKIMEIINESNPINNEEIKDTITTKFVPIVNSDTKEVAKRIVGNKISSIAQEILVQALNKSKTTKLDSLKNFFNSSKGKIAVKFVSSLIIDTLKFNFDPKYREVLTEISTEFRIQSETDLAIEVIDTVKDVIEQTDILKKLSNTNDHVRIQLENFESTTEVLPLEEKQKSGEFPEQKISRYIN
jgi:hypothetical protein